MPLSKRKKGESTEEVLPAGVVNRVQLSPYRVVLADVHTSEVQRQPLTKEINAVRFVEFNVRGLKNVSARVKGRLDELLGIAADQIDEIVQSGKANSHLRIRSPISGHVIKKYVREGHYFEEVSPLYDVADLSSVWIQAQIYEDDMVFLPLDQLHKPRVDDFIRWRSRRVSR